VNECCQRYVRHSVDLMAEWGFEMKTVAGTQDVLVDSGLSRIDDLARAIGEQRGAVRRVVNDGVCPWGRTASPRTTWRR
jgi:hypothetical protein